ncbi:MAG: methyltransferase [Deltaproteobacteria bacterium]|nr:methyltransferase [Deltaproteobacteria bacterium]
MSSQHDSGARFGLGSRSRLTRHHLDRFGGTTLFDRIGRAVANAECLPRKELFEVWEVAKRARRHLRGGRVIDLAAGHGLMAQVMLLLDQSSEDAIAVDARIPKSAAKLSRAISAEWPERAGRVSYVETSIHEPLPFELRPSDVIVSVHACGDLTDRVIGLAAQAGASVVVLPCCHAEGKGDTGGLLGWVDGALAMDLMRAEGLRRAGYSVRTFKIPDEITPKNRGLLGLGPGRGVRGKSD